MFSRDGKEFLASHVPFCSTVFMLLRGKGRPTTLDLDKAVLFPEHLGTKKVLRDYCGKTRKKKLGTIHLSFGTFAMSPHSPYQIKTVIL